MQNSRNTKYQEDDNTSRLQCRSSSHHSLTHSPPYPYTPILTHTLVQQQSIHKVLPVKQPKLRQRLVIMSALYNSPTSSQRYYTPINYTNPHTNTSNSLTYFAGV